MPAPEFARLAAAYENAPTEPQKNAPVECARRAYVGVRRGRSEWMGRRSEEIAPAALDPVQDKAEANRRCRRA